MRRIAATIVVAALAVTASASVVIAEQSPATGREHRNDRASRDHHRSTYVVVGATRIELRDKEMAATCAVCGL